MRKFFKGGCLTGVAVVVLGFIAYWSSRAELSRLDLSRVPTRAAWQLTDRVVEGLSLEPGDVVADLGAGGGYFTFPLADAVGPEGRVYAVDVDEGVVRELEEKVRERGYSNVEVVLAELDDPLLPDGEVDLVFLCNTYHHIDGRVAYFSRLETDLRDDGRVAIVEVRADFGGFARLLAPRSHSTAKETVVSEMEEAGYVGVEGFDFLPIQSFEIFARASGSSRVP